MKKTLIFSAFVLVLGVGYQTAVAIAPQDPKPTPAPTPTPKSPYDDIQKSFNKNCISCHGATRSANGIKLTTYDLVMKGGGDGPIVVKGDPTKSQLYLAVTATQGYGPMPPRGPKLSDKELKAIEAWIKAGAKK